MAKNTGISTDEHLNDAKNQMNTLRQLLTEGEKSGLTDYNYARFTTELDEHNHYAPPA